MRSTDLDLANTMTRENIHRCTGRHGDIAQCGPSPLSPNYYGVLVLLVAAQLCEHFDFVSRDAIATGGDKT